MTKENTFWCRRGTSLVGTMVAISILSIAIIGTANFRYYSALDSRKAVMLDRAARVAVTLSESWRAVGGTETYDPVENLGSDITITQSTVDEVGYDETFTLLGSYEVVLNGTAYYTTLSWKDDSTGLRTLNVIVTWAQRGEQGNGTDDSFKLTTYALPN